MGRSDAISLTSLSLGPERKVKCYNRYCFNGYVFHTAEYEHGRKTYNNGVCVKGSTCSEFEVDYYGKLEEVGKKFTDEVAISHRQILSFPQISWINLISSSVGIYFALFLLLLETNFVHIWYRNIVLTSCFDDNKKKKK